MQALCDGAVLLNRTEEVVPLLPHLPVLAHGGDLRRRLIDAFGLLVPPFGEADLRKRPSAGHVAVLDGRVGHKGSICGGTGENEDHMLRTKARRESLVAPDLLVVMIRLPRFQQVEAGMGAFRANLAEPFGFSPVKHPRNVRLRRAVDRFDQRAQTLWRIDASGGEQRGCRAPLYRHGIDVPALPEKIARPVFVRNLLRIG